MSTLSNTMNRMHNATNPFQGKYKKVLCVCSAGLLRSPTTAWVLSQEPYNCNTRAAGLTDSFALIPVDEVLIHWADEIVVMTKSQELELKERFKVNKPIKVLNLPDDFGYRDPELVKLIKRAYENLSF